MESSDSDKENQRLAALHRYGLLDTPAEEAFDCITRIAKIALNVSIALIVLVDKDRQWFKSKQGVRTLETSRDSSFCSRTIEGDKPLLVPNLKKDVLFAKNPLVCGFPFLRFYSGVPLRTRDGFNIGSLCVLGYRPRTLKTEEVTLLVELARLTMDQIELRHITDIDYLTGIASRNVLHKAGHREIERAQSTGLPLSMVIYEIEKFQEISKKYSYHTSDQLLQSMVESYKSNLKGGQLFARVGDGRLAILLPETNAAEAAQIASNIMAAAKKIEVPDVMINNKINYRIGSATYNPSDKDFNYFFTRAEIDLQKNNTSALPKAQVAPTNEEDAVAFSYGQTDL